MRAALLKSRWREGGGGDGSVRRSCGAPRSDTVEAARGLLTRGSDRTPALSYDVWRAVATRPVHMWICALPLLLVVRDTQVRGEVTPRHDPDPSKKSIKSARKTSIPNGRVKRALGLPTRHHPCAAGAFETPSVLAGKDPKISRAYRSQRGCQSDDRPAGRMPAPIAERSARGCVACSPSAKCQVDPEPVLCS